MLNIPTDLLRTLVAVVDMRSFTRAAQSLGLTQPAVSAQIKRLQTLLGFDLLDKSAPGIILTGRGETVLAQARRLLSINDEIVRSSAGPRPSQTLRVGIPRDFAGSRLPATLARIRLRWPGIGFHVSSGTSEGLLQNLQRGELDVVLGVSETEPTTAPRHAWKRRAAWMRSERTKLDPNRPVPLVCYGDDCACQRVAVAALQRAGRECEFVYTSRSLASLTAAVAAGFGIMAMPYRRVTKTGLSVWNDAPLPRLPELNYGIFVRDGGNRAVEELADYLAADLRGEASSSADLLSAAVTPIRMSGVG